MTNASSTIDPVQAITPPVRYPDRDVRQRELVPPSELAACRAVVIGVGAINCRKR